MKREIQSLQTKTAGTPRRLERLCKDVSGDTGRCRGGVQVFEMTGPWSDWNRTELLMRQDVTVH